MYFALAEIFRMRPGPTDRAASGHDGPAAGKSARVQIVIPSLPVRAMQRRGESNRITIDCPRLHVEKK